MSVRVRFAPSPTGSLHIGSVRTTLYNYFMARQHAGGQLILRIEDTDQDRLVPGAIDSIYDGLHWLGIEWDEGPREGGRYGPYVQSERLPLYQAKAQALVDSGAAYFCFCTKERLEQMRAAQRARGEITRYDRHCRNIPAAEAAERAKRESHVVRLNVPEDGTIAINVLGPDGKKLAKRHGATKVEEFRKEGYLPEAMINYLALIGWSPGTEEEIFTLDELVERWKIGSVQRAGGKWDRDRLNYFNGVWIRRLSDGELLDRLDPFLPAEWDRAVVRQVFPLIKERMTTLPPAKDLIGFLVTHPPDYDRALLVPKKREPHDAVTALSRVTVAVRFLEPVTAETIEQAIAAVANDVGWTVRDLSLPIRAAVTRRKDRPPLY